MKRSIFFCVLTALFACALSGTNRSHAEQPTKSKLPIVGAIRWDAWCGGSVTNQVEATLGPKKFRDRLPWFAEVIDEETVQIHGGKQEIMSKEIQFASEAGLDYWAFLIYPNGNEMSRALELYLANKNRDKINFCMILHNNLGVSEKDWPRERDRVIQLLKEPGYQTVLEERPLVYLFSANAQRFQELRQAIAKEGIHPYYVFMGWNPAGDYAVEKRNGFDAVSAYANGCRVETFAELVRDVEQNYWKNAADAKIEYVPFVTTGWDKQPRKEHPVLWELNDAYHHQEGFPSQATPQEIAKHLELAIRFTQEHQDLCPANAIIIYAWNEHDEGGWLVPVWLPDGKSDNSRLKAIGNVLTKE